jgi:hypothetical protein
VIPTASDSAIADYHRRKVPNDPVYRQVLHYVMYPSFSISWWTLSVQPIWSSTAKRREATQLSACAAW